MMPGPIELVVIMCVGVLLFGNRLPRIARSIGESIPSFKRGLREIGEDLDVNHPVRRTKEPDK